MQYLVQIMLGEKAPDLEDSMYNLQRVTKTGDTENVPVQNKYSSPDGWEMEYLTFPGLTKTGCVRHLFTTDRRDKQRDL